MAAIASSTASAAGGVLAATLAFALDIVLPWRKDGLQASSFGNETTSSDVAAPKSRSALARRGATALIGADLASLISYSESFKLDQIRDSKTTPPARKNSRADALGSNSGIGCAKNLSRASPVCDAWLQSATPTKANHEG